MTGTADCDLTEEHPLRLHCAQVDAAFLPTFGIKPYLGRNFTREEDRPNAPKVALASYGFWRSRLGGSDEAVGRTIDLGGVPTRIVGVLPSTFEMPDLVRVDLVVPQAIAQTQYRPGENGSRPIRVFGRLKAGVSLPQAFSQLQPFFREQLQGVPPGFRNVVRPVLRSVRSYQVGNAKLAAWLLFGGTLVILLIVGANVAGLLLARSVARGRELAVRTALGAGRWRLIRQTFTESGLLSLFGGVTGCAVAGVLLRLFKALAPAGIPRLQDVAMDGRILLFALVVTIVCGVLFAIAPALVSPRPSALTGRTANIATSRLTLRHLLITAQLALSLILVSVAALLLQSLWNLQEIRPGIDSEHVMTAEITLAPRLHPNSASRQRFFDELIERMRTMPGVTAVAVSDTAPPNGFVHSRPISLLEVPGRPVLPLGTGGIVDWRSVTPEYFRALGIAIVKGSGFREQDRASKLTEFVISASLARRLFGRENPVGRSIKLVTGANASTEVKVVGVAADVKNNGLSGKSDPEYYELRKRIDDPNAGANQNLTSMSLHSYDGHAIVLVRTALRPEFAAKWIRSETAALDPTMPVTISTLSAQVRALTERPRFNAVLLSAFALVGLLLAAAGLYGLISYLAMQRRQEIGLRMAVGATPRQIVLLILAHALRWTVAGIGIGVAGTWIASRFLGSLLFQASPRSPLLLGASATVLLVVAVAAALIPALRASRTDPVAVLRQE